MEVYFPVGGFQKAFMKTEGTHEDYFCKFVYYEGKS